MICPGCLKDVPDLIGPEDGLCVECYGIAAEDLIPSILTDWVNGGEALEDEDLEPWEDRFLRWTKLDVLGDLHPPLSSPGSSWALEDHPPTEEDPPAFFQGRRRF